MKDIIIIGAGGLAREIQCIIEKINEESFQWNLLGFIDENLDNKGKHLNGVEIIGNFEDVIESKYVNNMYYVCAIGDTDIKKRLVEKAESMNFIAATLIDPNVGMSKYISIGEGSVIYGNTNLTTNIDIGKHVIISPGCTIGHDSKVEDFAIVLPGSNISGNVIIKEKAMIGAGSVVIQGITIGQGTVIGAGAVVTKDIQEYATAVGCPAKIIKINNNVQFA